MAIPERSEIIIPSVLVKAVHTTGDGFVAGPLYGIPKNPKVLDGDRALTELCRFANAVGANHYHRTRRDTIIADS